MTSQAIYQCLRSGNLLLLQAAAGRTDGTVKRIRLLVDTGSSYTILWSEIAKEIGCDLQNPLRRLTTLTGGGTVTAPVVAVPWFSCLGHRVDNFPILTPNLPGTTFVDGLLGIDFLTRFQAVIYIREGEIRCPQSPDI
jgi:predicted aspartyl protease